ncbi:MAG: DUF3500 domain-containing protein [Bythopirellula sp.]|nr:DUF3500 domain-containing protein [Bythopirellula sp.]
MDPWGRCCEDFSLTSINRRNFLEQTGVSLLASGLAVASTPFSLRAAEQTAALPAIQSAESLVKLLYEALTPGQREKICFAWDHQDAKRGLLRTRVANNWDITDYYVNDDFYTGDQRALIRAVFENLYSPEWHAKIDQQLSDDSGGFGEQNSVAIFGEPGSEHFEFVMTGRHMTVRCDGNTTDHVAFGGPIFYGHSGEGFDEEAHHPGNVFWPQAVEANKLYQALDGKQQQLALVRRGMPREEKVGFQGESGQFQGIPLTELTSDQRTRVQEVLKKLVEPYRQNDRDEAIAALNAQGGLDACHLAFYEQGDIGKDKTWDNWRLEGPSFVWHFRGSPHVHVWVNVSDSASVKLNA